MARPSGSWWWGSCQPRISQLPCQFLHTRNHHQSHRLWMFMGCWGLMLNARTCQGMRFKAQLLHLPSYPVHSVVVTTAPVSETLSFGIVKLQADVTDADQASSTARAMVYVESQESSFQFHSSGCLQDIPVSSITGLVDSSSTSSDVITYADRRGLQKLLRVGQWKWGRTCRQGRGEHAGCTRFLGHCCDTWIGVGSSEQLWA